MLTNRSQRRISCVSACAVLFICLAVVPPPADAAMVVIRINGTPTTERAGKTTPLHSGDTAATGDVLVTDATAKAELLLPDGSLLTIGPKSRVVVDAFLADSAGLKARLRVLAGQFKIAIAKFAGGPSDYEIRTPTAVAGVRGTVLWGDTVRDAICALEGEITVRSLKAKGKPAHLGAGECVHRMGAGKTTPLKPTAAELAAYLAEVTLN